MIMLTRLAPSTAMTASARSTNGNVSMTLIPVMISQSVLPRKYPAASPSRTPTLGDRTPAVAAEAPGGQREQDADAGRQQHRGDPHHQRHASPVDHARE